MRAWAAMLAGLCLLPLAPPASAATVVVAQGTGAFVITECPVNALTFTMVALDDGSGWDAQIVLLDPDMLCFHALPLLSLTGDWDPAAGGCLAGQGLEACFAPVALGSTTHWGICRASAPVCDAANEFERGTALFVVA